MQQNGAIDINLTIQAWADIVLEKWRASIVNIPVVDTGMLRDSLKYTLFINAGSDIEKIEFSFKLYGIFVDIGAGRNRKEKNKDAEWFSRKYYAQTMKLKEILIDKYGVSIAWSVKNMLETPFDQALTEINIRNN